MADELATRIGVFLSSGKANYFCAEKWTGEIRLISFGNFEFLAQRKNDARRDRDAWRRANRASLSASWPGLTGPSSTPRPLD
jgi:hypothetical protein